MQAQTAPELLPLVARLQARKSTVAGCDVFAVPKGWAAEAVRAESGIVTACTPSELEAAVQDENTQSIFVPLDTFGPLLLERILRRNGLVKTIFWEE